MATKWVVTTPSDHIELDEASRGQTTFTVTNPTAKVDRVVFDIVAGDGADSSWFSVDEPQRRVPPSGSVSYLMKTSIPPTARAGSYSVQGRAYSADSAPEEDSVLSSRLAVEIKTKAAPAKKKFPWWIAVVAGLVVVVLVVVGILIFGSSTGQVAAPDLAHQSQAQAKTNLAVAGLTVGNVRHKQDAVADTVIYQSVAGGTKVAKGTAVDLVITSVLAAPTLTAPVANATVSVKAVAPQITPVPTSGAQPTASGVANSTSTDVLTWKDADNFVRRWQVTIEQQACVFDLFVRVQVCYFLNPIVVQVDKPSYTPILVPTAPVNGATSGFQVSLTPQFQWQVAAIDDFGNTGPESAWSPFGVR